MPQTPPPDVPLFSIVDSGEVKQVPFIVKSPDVSQALLICAAVGMAAVYYFYENNVSKGQVFNTVGIFFENLKTSYFGESEE